MFQIALFEPCIAPNTGNIIRLAANMGCKLHLIEPLGFSMDEKRLRRAGLDYHEFAEVKIHRDYWAFKSTLTGHRIIACTTKGEVLYTQLNFNEKDVLLFGAETHGLDQDVFDDVAAEHRVRIPMKAGSRSINLANAVAIVSYEAARQLTFEGLV
ncbi:MAG: tRNA (cytidine(34)-2'-O)-methyltransferase [Cellvibrionales bacterium]|nr:tRNA (cytidine(34)-2'-O)-methyltransferase [Cellvibrionales bacterium]